jgi:hypothetical protein
LTSSWLEVAGLLAVAVRPLLLAKPEAPLAVSIGVMLVLKPAKFFLS